jgi:hypothetical protein
MPAGDARHVAHLNDLLRHGMNAACKRWKTAFLTVKHSSIQDLALSLHSPRILLSEVMAAGSANQFKQYQGYGQGRLVQTFLGSPPFTNGASLSCRKSPHTLNSLAPQS